MNIIIVSVNIVARLQLPRMEGCALSEGEAPPSVAAYVPVVKVKLRLGQKNLQFLVSARVASDPRIGIFRGFFCYEMMPNCSKNCWIDSVALCFK